MSGISLVSLIFRPRAVRDVAVQRSEISAGVVNAVNGVAVMTAVSLAMLPFFTPALVAILGILFGPLVGLVVSSLYSRLEFTAGKRLGGKASLDDLYRIFAWSVLPVGLAALLYSFILLSFKKPGITTTLILSIPSLVIACFAIRNYCSNIIALQQFARKRGIVSLVLTLILFVVVIGGGVGVLSLLLKYCTGENLKWILS